jgi:asparagine synthase (glutamine-hydrolysing)
MCGIAGIRRFDGAPVPVDLIGAMTDTLVHRGPDDRNVYVNGSVGFGHTRLSIIDLAGSSQPMQSADGRFTLVFNGEIFNYRELRSGLSYPWATQGDTEVLLASVAKDGPEAAGRFVGQFAFGMYDHATRDTLLIRDRVGILPLYYYVDANLLAFASEVKALLMAIPGGAQLDHSQLASYLSARAVSAPDTLFLGVKKVRPGHVLRVSATGAVTSEAYWTPPDPSDRLEMISDQSAIDLVDEALVAAVDSSLVADVPVGSYLSGGVDSSLIVALATAARVRLGSAEPVKTFSADFGDSRVDETKHADFVSEVFGTDHTRVRVQPSDFRDRWSDLTWHRDAPISEPADIAVARLAEAAREHVKVVLSGEGSDELFGGYPKYRFANVTKWAGLVPAELRLCTLRPVEQALPAGRARLRIAVRAMTAQSAADRMSTWFAPFTSYECAALLGTSATPRRPAIPHHGGVDLMGRVDLAGWLPDNLLERGDRMSMAASLELRPPFLDHRIVDLAFRLPGSLKVRSGTTKWVLKQVALRYLPQRIVMRPKVGFRVPLDAWFRDGLRDLSYDMLTGRDSFVGGILDQYHIRRILASHASGRRDEENRIWTLMSLEMWGRQFITGHGDAL